MKYLILHRCVIHLFCILIPAITFVNAPLASAQEVGTTIEPIDPLGAQYYLNRYLGNPAMAGTDSALNLTAVYRDQWQNIPGAPIIKAFTADAYLGRRVGAGLIVNQDNAGLINRTRVAMTYAYHLPLNNERQQLHFGLSLALLNTHIDRSKIQGEADDPAVSEYNRFGTFFESDFGVAYTDPHWTVQAALPNVVGFFRKNALNTADVSSFYTALSYKFLFNGSLSGLEPLMSYRGVKGNKGILNIGCNAGFLDDQVNLFGMYHSTGNFTAGMGVTIASSVAVQAFYTSQTSGLRSYFQGKYEINLNIRLFNKKIHLLE